jgi:ABC-type glycerol-3-phosphate transport system permease component
MKRYSVDRLLPPSISRIGTAVLLIFIAVPVLYLFLLALSTNRTVALGGTGLKHLTFGNFTSMWSATSLLHGLVNSVIIAGISAVLAVILGVATAYPLSRLRFRGRKPLLYSLLGSLCSSCWPASRGSSASRSSAATPRSSRST